MDIGIVVGAVTPRAGGLFHSVRLPSNRLTADGHSVTVYGIGDAEVAGVREQWAVTELKVYPSIGPLNFGYAPALRRALLEARHDVVHQHGLWMHQSTAVLAWRRRTGCPTVISPRGMLDPWAVNYSGWKKRLVGRLFEYANLHGAACLHALNHSEAEAIRAFGLRNPIAIIPNGVDLPDRRERHIRPSWLPEDGRRALLFLARIHPKKGVLELVGAWSKLKSAQPSLARKWRIVIAGWDDGGHVEILKRQIADYNLHDDIILPGALQGTEKAAALTHANAFILPSHSEGLPMSVLEAWAFGLPVFMTRACNLPEGFVAGAAREITIEPGALPDQLAEGLADPALSKLGERGRCLVETRFTWADIARRQRELYFWLVGGGAVPEFLYPVGT